MEALDGGCVCTWGAKFGQKNMSIEKGRFWKETEKGERKEGAPVREGEKEREGEKGGSARRRETKTCSEREGNERRSKKEKKGGRTMVSSPPEQEKHIAVLYFATHTPSSRYFHPHA